MLGWFYRWRARRRRGLFKYFNGRTIVGIDPLAVMQGMAVDPEYTYAHAVLATEGDDESYRICLRMVNRVFGVEPYDAATKYGLTEMERMNLFGYFNGYLLAQKKTTNSTPIALDNTESTLDTSSGPITNGTLDSASTPTDSTFDRPTVSAPG